MQITVSDRSYFQKESSLLKLGHDYSWQGARSAPFLTSRLGLSQVNYVQLHREAALGESCSEWQVASTVCDREVKAARGRG